MLRLPMVLASLSALLDAGGALAQEAAATPDAATSGPSTVEQTELSFSSVDTGLQIQIVDGGPGRIGERDCRTPCRFRVSNGWYVLRAGSHEFEVTASGGLQHWAVEDDDGSWLAVGIIGMVVGAAAASLGTWGLVEYVPRNDLQDPWLIGSAVSTSVGGAVFVGGVVAVALSFGSAELLSYSQTITESATLSPRLAVFPDANGEPGWGLSLLLNI